VITLKSGRQISANGGIIGLSPSLELSEGYDSSIGYPAPEWAKPDEMIFYISDEDARELAIIMIERWKQFLSKIPPAAPL
jgi:hypothetical protein